MSRGMPYTNNLDTLGPGDVRYVDTDKRSDYAEADESAEQFIRNKPTIPSAQIQADWNQANNSKADFIKNKPTIPAAQIPADWNQANSSAADFIKNKPTIPALPSAPEAGASDATYVLKVSSGGSLSWVASDVYTEPTT